MQSFLPRPRYQRPSYLRPDAARRKIKIAIGQEFGGWTVIGHATSIASGTAHRTAYLCKCKCGTIKPVRATSLVRGESKSCNDPKCFVRNERIGAASAARSHKNRQKADATLLNKSWR